ncbi:MAG TPA: hypothetical protein VGG88_05780 [Gaiellaceae bacterium]
MHDGGRPSRRGLDERAQSAGGGDPLGEREPDPERRREDEEREDDDEAAGTDAVTGGPGQEREQRERPADRRNRKAEQNVSREALVGTSRLCGARPRDGSAPAASGDAGNIEELAHALHTKAAPHRI